MPTIIESSFTNMSLNLYLEQQRIEDLEDKYADLQRQHELLKKENELLKAGNYNLKRDNDALRNDIYNLRLENSKLSGDYANLLESSNDEKDDLTGKIVMLEQKYENKIKQLNRTINVLSTEVEIMQGKSRLLPKVAEKDNYRQFMLDCVIPVERTTEFVTTQTNFIESILRGDDYIVHSGSEFLITNLGKIFLRSPTNYQRTHMWGYTDLKIKEMSKEILNIIIKASEPHFGHNGYVELPCTFGLTFRGKHTF